MKSEAAADNPEGEARFLEGDQAYDAGDYKLAFTRMKKAAELGHAGAMLSLGVYYDTGLGVRRSREKAMYWYKAVLGVNRRHGAAASNIGTIYRDEKNFGRAKFWFEKALTFKDVDAAYELAKIYLLRVTPARVEKARAYLRMCVAKKNSPYITPYTCEQAAELLKTLPKLPRRS